MKFYQKGSGQKRSKQKGGGYFSNSQARVDRFNGKAKSLLGGLLGK
jgi:hypothetical protein